MPADPDVCRPPDTTDTKTRAHMDPLSHAVAGRAVVSLLETGEPPMRGVGAAAILGALSPDIDSVLAPAGWDIYLRAHEIGTHSIAGSLVVAGCAAALVRRLTPGSRYGALWAAASAGALSHVALDVLSGARIRAGWPLVPARVTLPLVAMADPWLLGIFIAGGIALWMGRRQRMRRAAQLTLGAAVAFLCLKGALLGMALRSSNLQWTTPPAIEARWGSLVEWNVFERAPTALRAWRIHSRGTPPALVLSVPLERESPLSKRSRTLDTVRNFLDVYEFGFPTEEVEGGMRTGVFWSDIRFCWRANPTQGSMACGLWFGGIFGADGRAITQEVKVGSWVQKRAATRP
jgi:membrane-bound metal-dependent hydrolase YbcI (DUF457 family)